MFDVVALIASVLLSGQPLLRWPEGDISWANREIGSADVFQKHRNLGEPNWEEFCRVKDRIIAGPHIDGHHRNANFQVGMSNAILRRHLYPKLTPVSAFISFGRSECVAVTIEKGGSIDRLLNPVIEPSGLIVRKGNIIGTYSIDDVVSCGSAYVLNTNSHEKLEFLDSIGPTINAADFINRNSAVEGCTDCEPGPKITFSGSGLPYSGLSGSFSVLKGIGSVSDRLPGCTPEEGRKDPQPGCRQEQGPRKPSYPPVWRRIPLAVLFGLGSNAALAFGLVTLRRRRLLGSVCCAVAIVMFLFGCGLMLTLGLPVTWSWLI